MEEQAAEGKCPADGTWSGSSVVSDVQNQLSGSGVSGSSVAAILESSSSTSGSASTSEAGSAAHSDSSASSISGASSNSQSSANGSSHSASGSQSSSLSGSQAVSGSASSAGSQSASIAGSASGSSALSASDASSSSSANALAGSNATSASGSAANSNANSGASSNAESNANSNASSGSNSNGLYDSVLGQTGNQQGSSHESALSKAVAEAQAESASQATASATAECEARAQAAASAQAQAEATASALQSETRSLQQQVQEMNRRRASDYASIERASEVSFSSASDMWSKLSSSVRQAWSSSMHLSESQESSAFQSLVTTGASYAASSSTYAEAAASISASFFLSMSASAQATRLRTHGVLGGLAYLGELAIQAQAASSFFQRRCDATTGRRQAARKDLFLGVAEALADGSVDRVCHEGRQWRVDSRTGTLVLAADYTAGGIAAALLDDARQPDLRSRIELGDLLDALFDHFDSRSHGSCGGGIIEPLARDGIDNDRRTALEVLWTNGRLEDDEYAWLERLVSAYERWDVDLAENRDPASKLVSLVASAPPLH